MIAERNFRYFVKDYLGNVRSVIDNAGHVLEHDGYYPYGAASNAAAASVQLQLSCDNRQKYVKFRGEIITDLNTQDEFELYPSVTDPSGLTIRRRLRLYL